MKPATNVFWGRSVKIQGATLLLDPAVTSTMIGPAMVMARSGRG
jgi:hypothetical protein